MTTTTAKDAVADTTMTMTMTTITAKDAVADTITTTNIKFPKQ